MSHDTPVSPGNLGKAVIVDAEETNPDASVILVQAFALGATGNSPSDNETITILVYALASAKQAPFAETREKSEYIGIEIAANNEIIATMINNSIKLKPYINLYIETFPQCQKQYRDPLEHSKIQCGRGK